MEQRPLRLGDILDDYCPRERRVTNHAVVAMIEEDVKQTRCTTCDTEHVYKGGKAPRRKKPETAGALYKEVLAGITDQDATPAADLAVASEPNGELDVTDEAAPPAVSLVTGEAGKGQDDTEADESQPVLPVDEGPVHRPLIRAQLARPEGIKIERQAPEFTIRQNSGRGGGGGGRGGGPNQGFGRGPSGGGPSRGPRKRSR